MAECVLVYIRVDHLKNNRIEKEKVVRKEDISCHCYGCSGPLLCSTSSPLPLPPQLAEEKRAEHWRANCPELREMEVRQRENALKSTWKEQVDRKTEVDLIFPRP